MSKQTWEGDEEERAEGEACFSCLVYIERWALELTSGLFYAAMLGALRGCAFSEQNT